MQPKMDKPKSDAMESKSQLEPQTKQMENRSWGLVDLIEMQTEFALCQSMAGSKTLTAMVCLGLLGYGGFILLLFKMAS
ncbi:hypothetical protein L1D44_08225 [Shewanella sp. Isolate13]|uniref:hypothetical protein n=1 Tax=Shewanella sp. Isolate13 TaxID=2908531 RepID=UPI001EFDCDA3|nr:hypothetical protein [Shewanella sp. Isolate13]MCG9729835.1 hypothetical protein [Shewanella sp. Isolate13]